MSMTQILSLNKKYQKSHSHKPKYKLMPLKFLPPRNEKCKTAINT
ncbi:hypothetical protein SLEP1_g13374 [Rubroshorea leprosula]|uniref:Uncharacterized protein n=1 Tax=Rubroshorea leprosula TaxID=152421 RepID=A0AAV5ILJ2_9ROSI|nr:hypothetical protein SLEP1_g13374 [Rubroshorea leprosula]